MILKTHATTIDNGGTFGCGLILLEEKPKYKTIIHGGKYTKLAFPYLLYSIIYSYNYKINKEFYYGGLRIFAHHKSITSFQDKVSCCPTEIAYNGFGYICTPHAYDDKKYTSIKKLVDTVVQLWHGLEHSYVPVIWSRQNLKDVIDPNCWMFENKNSLSSIIYPQNYNGLGIKKFAKKDWTKINL